MRQRFRRNEDWCPECGHLLPKKTWSCQVCGWALNDMDSYASGIDLVDTYSDISKISKDDRELDRLLDSTSDI